MRSHRSVLIMVISKWFTPLAATAWLLVASTSATAAPPEVKKPLPDPLKAWADWALWDEKDLDSPSPYHNPKQALRLWPSRLSLEVSGTGGRFDFEATVFNETWVPLPGDGELWPVEVTANGTAVPVVEHKGRPAVKLAPGKHQLAGSYRWLSVPQRIAMPLEIGILSLKLNDRPVESPVWDAQGFLWLKRDASTEQTDKDFLGVKAHSLLEDGIPMMLHTDVELIVAGKSREETLGNILPSGWKLASVQSPVPVAVDESGVMKAQVRAGKWTVHVSAFRLNHPAEISFEPGVKTAAPEQLIAFKAQPDFRLVEIIGLPAVDVSQTSFPNKWREFPVYRWETQLSFQMEERMRGMGLQKPEGLSINRELWLDQDGGGLTFRDTITGTMQQIWRLDAAKGQALGSVRADEQGQLITRNPQSGAPGVEIRNRAMNLEATGRMKRAATMHASGWQTNAEKLGTTLHLPPGWRLFALFGADWVNGDWLTTWTLLDLFLLLVFTLAVMRMRGVSAAVLAFIGFGLSYHEPGAPRYVWLVMLIPLALLKVVPAGWGKQTLVAGKWLALLVLVLLLVPFSGKQIQQAIYPQLEDMGGNERHFSAPRKVAFERGSAGVAAADAFADSSSLRENAKSGGWGASQNLNYDIKARIQTGPGVPEWQWRTVSFGWNGPVTSAQTIRPILIPMHVERFLSLLRVILLLGLAGVLLKTRRVQPNRPRNPISPLLAAIALWMGFSAMPARAQFPEKDLLESMRQRLTETSDAYPTAADIPIVMLNLNERKLVMDMEIHTATRTAVPLPGRLPTWSPVSVTVNGRPEATLRRADGFLWLVLPAGVHLVTVKGVLADLAEWQWTWQLRPRRVSIDAPGWQINGVKPGGIPEAQVFFTRIRKAPSGEASYDQPNLQNMISVTRDIELGLVWQVRSSVNRLSSGDGAVSLRVPLLPGENVLTSNVEVKEGYIEVRLGAGQQNFSWQSELPITSNIDLSTRTEDPWVERWSLVVSPVWNVSITGLPPVFDAENSALVPVWKPWPGESTALQISRPDAIAGATVTVGSAHHVINVGKRQRSSSLKLALRCSIGEDFLIGLPADAEVTSLTNSGTAIPIRKDGHRVIIPLKPGEQEVMLQWKQNVALRFGTHATSIKLPVESSNVTTTLHMPDDRWTLWAGGPLRGPAVRFWGILLGSLIAAWVLGRLSISPLKTHEWMLLAIGLTQIPLPAALIVVTWLFFLACRGEPSYGRLADWSHNFLQITLIVITVVVLGIFIAIVAEGLLGNPEMFISGNGSYRTMLHWFEDRCAGALPQPFCFSISIWWYRLIMLLWALWLAAALIRWLTWGWRQFNTGGCFRRSPKAVQPPPLPGQNR